MPQIKLDLPIEVLNEWARLANERKEPVKVTLANFVSQEARKLTKRAADVAYECPKCGATLEKGGWCEQHGLPAQPRR